MHRRASVSRFVARCFALVHTAGISPKGGQRRAIHAPVSVYSLTYSTRRIGITRDRRVESYTISRRDRNALGNDTAGTMLCNRTFFRRWKNSNSWNSNGTRWALVSVNAVRIRRDRKKLRYPLAS